MVKYNFRKELTISAQDQIQRYINMCLNKVLKRKQPWMRSFTCAHTPKAQLTRNRNQLLVDCHIQIISNLQKKRMNYCSYSYQVLIIKVFTILCVLCSTLYLEMKVSECFTVVWLFSVRIRHRLTNLYLFINQQSQDQYLPVSSSKHRKEQVKW